MLTHVVVLQFESLDHAEACKTELLGMEGRIDSLRAIEAGVDVLRSERSWDLALITRFDDLAGLKAYAVHPVHLEVLEFIRPRAKGVVTVDFQGSP